MWACEVHIEWRTQTECARGPSLCLRSCLVFGTWGIQSCLHTVKCRPTQFPVLLMQFTAIARLHGGFTRLIVRSADMVCSSYIVKHLLKLPLQGVCLSPFACVWHLHGHDCRPSIWIEPAAHWRFTTSYERAQRPDICLCGFGETKGRGPRINKPSGRLQRAGKASGSPRSVLRPQTDSDERSDACPTRQGAAETHFHTRPPSGVNKVITSRGGCPQSAKRQIICLMAGSVVWLSP